MSKKKKLTELLTNETPDFKELMIYGRSKKDLKDADLVKLAVLYHDMKKHNPQMTPLHVACWSGTKPAVVRTLVSEGWDVNTGLNNVGSPLGLALDNGNISIANLLIDLGADVNMFCNGFTPMYFCLSIHNKEKTCVAAIEVLLKSGVSVDAVVNRDSKKRPIHIAVRNNLPSVVSFLLQKGANPNIKDKYGDTPIHIAVCNNQLDMVKLLLLHEVDLYIENDDGETPLLIAVRHDNVGIIKELCKGGCDIDRPCANGKLPIHSAVFFHKMEAVKLMVALGANINKVLPNGATPLHTVATRNLERGFLQEKENVQERIDMAEFLVENGAILNRTDNSMSTPLQDAVGSRLLSLAKFLIKSGADFNTRNSDGDTIFHQVVPLNRDIILLLLEFGGDYNAYNQDKLTPYHLAICHGVDVKFIKSFIKHGCPYDQDLAVWTDLVKKNKVVDLLFASEKKFFKGITENNLELVKGAIMDGAVPSSCCEELRYPLHSVALHGYNELLTFLLEENVQPNTLNEEGKTPLYLAASKGHYDTCRILLRYGACFNYRSKMCPKTPKMVANDLKHNTVVDLFDTIGDLFLKTGSKKVNLVKYLESKIKSNFDYLMFVNVTNAKGNTLLTSALEHGNAQQLLKMKVNNNLHHIE